MGNGCYLVVTIYFIVVFSYRVSLVESRTELYQFLRIFLLTILNARTFFTEVGVRNLSTVKSEVYNQNSEILTLSISQHTLSQIFEGIQSDVALLL